MLLIDEIDRTDEPFEAFLLEALSDYQVTIPELGTVHAEVPPIVVLTSNRTREVHDALKRRCLYHWVDYPDFDRELAILRRARAGGGRGAGREVVAFVQRLRARGPVQEARCRRDHRLGPLPRRAGRRRPSPEVIADTLGRAPEVPGRHRPPAGLRGQAPARRGRAPSSAPASIAGSDPPRRRRAARPRTSPHFARALRKAGLPVGTGRVDRRDPRRRGGGLRRPRRLLPHAAGLLRQPRPSSAWSSPRCSGCSGATRAFLEQMMSLLLPMVRGVNPAPKPRPPSGAPPRRWPTRSPRPAGGRGRGEIEIDATLTFSAARAAAAHRLRADVGRRARGGAARDRRGWRCRSGRSRSRRTRVDARGRVPDWRGTMRAALRSGGDVERLVLRRRRTRWPTWWRSATSRARCRTTGGCCCTFLHAVANARAPAGPRCTPSPSAPG